MSDIVESMHELLELLAPLSEAALGYRNELIRAGWSPESAEAIARELLISLNSSGLG